jgi:hypothetical protein
LGSCEADQYKFGSDCLIYVEELFSFLTLQTYIYNNDSIFESKKTLCRKYFQRMTLTKQAHLIVTIIETDTDRGHDEDSAAASGSQVHIWSR